MVEQIASALSEVGETIGEAAKAGGEFARAFKTDSGFGKDFAEAFRKDGETAKHPRKEMPQIADGNYPRLREEMPQIADGEATKYYPRKEMPQIADGNYPRLREEMPQMADGNYPREEIPQTDSSFQAKNILNPNADLANKKHPETGVPYKEKTVKDDKGNDIKVVVPEFDSQFDAQLPEDLCQATDKKQFKECNRQLKDSVDKNPELAKKFTPEQLEQIKNGDTPDGYTWHHNEEKGKMQLVDSETHANTRHVGGRAIWGGGQEKR